MFESWHASQPFLVENSAYYSANELALRTDCGVYLQTYMRYVSAHLETFGSHFRALAAAGPCDMQGGREQRGKSWPIGG